MTAESSTITGPTGFEPTGFEPIEFGPTDHTYLHLETAGRPMHWGLLVELAADAAPLPVAAVRERIVERATHPLFRTGVTAGRWRRPRMVEVAQVDPVTQASEARYTDGADLQAQLGMLMSTHLPRGGPMWHLTLFTPAQPAKHGGGQLLLLRVHHSLSDGIAGGAFATLLADDAGDGLVEFDRFLTSARFAIRGIDKDRRATAKAAFGDAWKAGETGRRWPSLSKAGGREVRWHSISTRDLRRAAKNAGASSHEFVLAAVGAAISATPPTEASTSVRVTVPATLDKEFRHSGNAVAATLLNLAGNESAVADQLPAVREQLSNIEKTEMELYLAAADDDPRAPWPIFRALSQVSMGRMSPDIHVGVNPGFTRVRSVLGAPLTELTALSPLVGYSFSVTAVVLGTRTSFGIVYDAEALPGYGDRFVNTFAGLLRESVTVER